MGIVPTLDCTPDTTRHFDDDAHTSRCHIDRMTHRWTHGLHHTYDSCIVLHLCEICLRGKKLKLYGFTKGSTTLVSQ